MTPSSSGSVVVRHHPAEAGDLGEETAQSRKTREWGPRTGGGAGLSTQQRSPVREAEDPADRAASRKAEVQGTKGPADGSCPGMLGPARPKGQGREQQQSPWRFAALVAAAGSLAGLA